MESMSGTMTFNVPRIGWAFFESSNRTDQDRLIIHELAHHFVRPKSSKGKTFYQAVERVAAALVAPGQFGMEVLY